ncbi:bifunctional DNA primase/polymerase [Streptacidiphilus monticola]
MATRYGITMPRTALVVTQSGGLHAWLSAPPDVVVPNTASVLAQGVDTRGSGGYLVGPGSLGPRGRYAFAPGSGPQHIAPVPPRLLELLTPPHKPAQARSKGIRPGSSSGSPQRRLDALVRFVRGDASRDATTGSTGPPGRRSPPTESTPSRPRRTCSPPAWRSAWTNPRPPTPSPAPARARPETDERR